jgi:FeS assembly SUF system regulator
MIRISKLTDYALVILAFLSKEPQQFAQAGDIALNTNINKPTTAKVLKTLARHGLLESCRGSAGGYKLTKLLKHISVAEIVQILEGPMAIMDCSLGQEHCAISKSCEIRAPWNKINQVIIQALETIKLSDLLPLRGEAL